MASPGLFDDLVPQTAQPQGLFDDLVPQTKQPYGPPMPPLGAQTGGKGDYGPVSSTITDVINRTVQGAYQWGGNDPKKGTDCSGATCAVAKEYGVNLPRTAIAQYQDKRGKAVNPKALQPGDLVFFETKKDPSRVDKQSGRSVTHVGIYVGNGKFRHQSTDNAPGMTEANLADWQKKMVGAKRFEGMNAERMNGEAFVNKLMGTPQKAPQTQGPPEAPIIQAYREKGRVPTKKDVPGIRPATQEEANADPNQIYNDPDILGAMNEKKLEDIVDNYLAGKPRTVGNTVVEPMAQYRMAQAAINELRKGTGLLNPKHAARSLALEAKIAQADEADPLERMGAVANIASMLLTIATAGEKDIALYPAQKLLEAASPALKKFMASVAGKVSATDAWQYVAKNGIEPELHSFLKDAERAANSNLPKPTFRPAGTGKAKQEMDSIVAEIKARQSAPVQPKPVAKPPIKETPKVGKPKATPKPVVETSKPSGTPKVSDALSRAKNGENVVVDFNDPDHVKIGEELMRWGHKLRLTNVPNEVKLLLDGKQYPYEEWRRLRYQAHPDGYEIVHANDGQGVRAGNTGTGRKGIDGVRVGVEKDATKGSGLPDVRSRSSEGGYFVEHNRTLDVPVRKKLGGGNDIQIVHTALLEAPDPNKVPSYTTSLQFVKEVDAKLFAKQKQWVEPWRGNDGDWYTAQNRNTAAGLRSDTGLHSVQSGDGIIPKPAATPTVGKPKPIEAKGVPKVEPTGTPKVEDALPEGIKKVNTQLGIRYAKTVNGEIPALSTLHKTVEDAVNYTPPSKFVPTARPDPKPRGPKLSGTELAAAGRKAREAKSLDETLIRWTTDTGKSSTGTLRQHADAMLAEGKVPKIIETKDYAAVRKAEKTLEALRRRRWDQLDPKLEAEQKAIIDNPPTKMEYRAVDRGDDGRRTVITKAQFEYMNEAKSGTPKKSAVIKAQIDAEKAALKASNRKLPKNAGGWQPTKEDYARLKRLATLYPQYYGAKSAEFVEHIVKELGEHFRPHAQKAWDDVHPPKTTARPPEAPKKAATEPKTVSGSGISKATQAQQAEELGTSMPKTTVGDSDAVATARAEKALDDGSFDPVKRAKELSDEGKAPNSDEAHAFRVHKDRLVTRLKDAASQLDNPKLSDAEREALVKVRDNLRNEVDDFNLAVENPRGEAGRALRVFGIGRDVDYTNFEDVQLEFKRVHGRAPTMSEAGALKNEIDRLKQVARTRESAEAGTYIRQASRTRRDSVTVLRNRREAAKTRIKNRIAGTFKEEMGQANILPFKSVYNALRATPGIAKDLLEIMSTVIQERGLKKLDRQLFDAIRKEVPDMELTDDLIRQVLAGDFDIPVTKDASDYANVRKQARAASDAVDKIEIAQRAQRIKKMGAFAQRAEAVEGQIRTGITIAPGQREIDPLIEKLRLSLTIGEKRVKAMVRLQDVSKARKIAKEVLGTARLLKLGSDFGVLVRQGLFGLSHPKAYGAALSKVGKAMKSDELMYLIEEQSLTKELADGRLAEPLRRKAGLSRSDYFSDPEEAFMVNWLKKVPVLKKVVGKLERGQSAFLNTLRNEMFDSFSSAHPDATAKELKEWAEFINSATGRSNLRSVPHWAEWVMTSPRYETSRWEMIGHYLKSPKTAWNAINGNRAARRKLTSMGSTAGGLLTAIGIGKAAGWWDADMDPKSSDFLKMRVGQQVFDFTAGISPRIRTAARLISATTIPQRIAGGVTGKPYQEELTKAGKQKRYDDTMDAGKEMGKAGTRTISPGITTPLAFLANRDLGGWALDDDEKGWKMAAPLIISGAYTGYEKEGYVGALRAFASEFIGGGVGTYPKSKPR